jgi:hypothetical protein
VQIEVVILVFKKPENMESPCIEIVRNALLINSPNKDSAVTLGGVFDENGVAIKRALHASHRENLHNPEYHEHEGASVGHGIFGGYLFGSHFGHVITESTGRLWAAKELRHVDKLFFLPGFNCKTIPDFFIELLQRFGVEQVPTLITKSIRVEKLYVPSQLFGLGRYLRAHPEFVNFAKSLTQFGSATDVESERKVYISRSEMGLHKGGVASERLLEKNLSLQGYEIVHPERLSLEEQLRLYLSCRTLIFCESSAIHLYGLVANARQKVGVVVRRDLRHCNGFKLQLEAFAKNIPSFITAQKGYLVPNNVNSPFGKALTILDFKELRKQLSMNGFIDSRAEWLEPRADEIEDCKQSFLSAHNGLAAWKDASN